MFGNTFGHGHWLVASDGGAFCNGDAGSLWIGLNRKTQQAGFRCSMSATPLGHG